MESPDEAWPSIVVRMLQNEGIEVTGSNAGLSGDTTSGGYERLEWVLTSKPDIFVLELGANDMLRGLNTKTIESQLKKIIQKVKTTYPKVKILLVGMRATPNLGKKYSQDFDSIFPRLAKEEGVLLVPFLLENVAGIPSLNQKDGIHPTPEGHALLAKTVYPFLKKLIVSK